MKQVCKNCGKNFSVLGTFDGENFFETSSKYCPFCGTDEIKKVM